MIVVVFEKKFLQDFLTAPYIICDFSSASGACIANVWGCVEIFRMFQNPSICIYYKV